MRGAIDALYDRFGASLNYERLLKTVLERGRYKQEGAEQPISRKFQEVLGTGEELYVTEVEFEEQRDMTYIHEEVSRRVLRESRQELWRLKE